MGKPSVEQSLHFTAAVFVNERGGAARRVSPDGGLYYQACIHPTGRELVCFGGTTGRPRLWRICRDMDSIEPLTPADSGARHGVYDWAGQRIAFASDRDGPDAGERIETLSPATREVPADVRLNLFIADVDGRNDRQLTHGPYHDHRPTFSPDGDTVVFASNRTGATGLWQVNVNGKQPPRPLFTDHWAYRPWFAADGRSLFFYGPDGDRHRIYRLLLDGGAPEPLPRDDRGMTHGPFVDPATDTLLVHSTRGGDWGLWEMPTDDDEPRCITPPNLDRASHPTRARNGTIACDRVQLLH